jgi:Cu+-exporting ATPase
LPERPCPVCGVAVEPLRAAEVLLLDDGFRFFCSRACRDRHGESLRASSPGTVTSERPRASSWSSGSDSGTTTARKLRARSRDAGWTGARRVAAPPPIAPPVIPLGLAAAALLASAFADAWALAAIAILFVAVSAVLALFFGGHVRASAGWPAWIAAPLGALTAAAAGGLSALSDADPRAQLAGAALAAALANARWWVDATSARTTEHLLDELAAGMPERTRVPLSTDPAARTVASTDVDASRVRVGEEIMASEGEVIAVDGAVRAGEAQVLLHPSATAPVRRGPGDAVMAGARVVDGVVRVLATHVGDDRALVRPRRFGDGRADDAAPLTRFALRAEVAAAVALALGVIVAVALNGTGESLAASLSAVAAVLVGAPLLSMRRAADTPYVVAGAAAAERGVSFASARSLDRAGRTSVVAISTRGALTEGSLEIAEAHPFEASLREVLASVAAAEREVEGNAIARALVRHADELALDRPTVRRVVPVPGRGVRATCAGGEPMVIGTRQLLLDDGVSVAAAEGEAARGEARGLVAVFAAIDRKVRAVFLLRDEDRPGARAAVQRFIDLGIEVVLLSGDSRTSVESLARRIGVDHVRSDLTPEERIAEVRRLRDAGGVVAAIAHPAHDPDLLGAADVPIVLAAAGSPDGDRAIALSGDDVRDAAGAVFVAHAARREATRAAAVAAIGGAALVVLGATGVGSAAMVAVLALGIDAFVLPTGARVLRRIELRLPARG